MLNLTFLTGAGISCASGLPLFTQPDSDLDENQVQGFSVTDLTDNRNRMITHYNHRTNAMSKVNPTDAHHLIVALEQHYRVRVITQNIDNLHERAGTKEVVHLHGQLTRQRTDKHCCRRIETIESIDVTSHCLHGAPWRHAVVLYGEPIQHYDQARHILAMTDILMVVGCSMQTNAPQMLIKETHAYCPIYFINPFPHYVPPQSRLIKQRAYQGIWTALNDLLA